ncbi:ABC transporter permease [Variovorax sp. J22R133]|uniref:ABC transporter permease n=1 Tax=Variovorax brevis TaxID=3053503 RepID=UPI00257733B3|nr:ABC transporter permease [Variovorax sp. J22R133]MDM0115339.1 ABC transporter permease [Variovorax sp. J22R133]
MLIALIKKELIALGRDLHGLAALFLMPVIFIVVMSLALKDYYNPPMAALHYAVDPQDHGAPAQLVLAAWKNAHGAPRPLPTDWRAQLLNGQLKYVIVLQPGLSDALDANALPTQARMQLLAEPGIDGNLFNALRAELVGAAGEVKGRLEFTVAGGPPPPPGASMTALVQAERFAPSGPRPTAVQQSVPAWLVFGMFFVVASMSSLFIQERASGTLGRLHSLGVSTGMLLVSKALPYLGVNALQAALMLAVGVWLMPLLGGDALSLAGIHWGALCAALAAISMAAVSLSLALACAVRTHAQAATVGPIVNVLMAAVGGIMVPKFVMPVFMQRVAEWSPMSWGLEALLTAVLRGGGLAAMLPDIIRLVVFSAVMLALAALLFQRRAAA